VPSLARRFRASFRAKLRVALLDREGTARLSERMLARPTSPAKKWRVKPLANAFFSETALDCNRGRIAGASEGGSRTAR